MATRSRTSSARRSRVVTASPTARPPKSTPAKRVPVTIKPTAELPAKDVQPAGQAGRWQALADWAGGGLPLATLIVSVLGLGVSVYMTFEHFTQNSSLACPATSTLNCAKVTTSPQSYLFGQHWLPVAVLGLAFYLFMVAINSPWGWRAHQPLVHWARLVSVIVGIVFVLYLIYAELFLINSICLYCTAVHVLTFALFGLIVTRTAFSGARPVPPRTGA